MRAVPSSPRTAARLRALYFLYYGNVGTYLPFFAVYLQGLGFTGQEIGIIQMLPPAEMDFAAFSDVRDRLCTFASKFDPQSRHYQNIHLRLPAVLTPAEYARLEKTAIAAYRALDCRDYARLDIRLRDGIFYVLDINPNADLSSDSSTACAAEVAGYSFGAMGSHLVNLAALRHPVFSALAA